MALLPNHNLVIGNTGNASGTNLMVEITPAGKLLATRNVDKGAAGALFGIVASGTPTPIPRSISTTTTTTICKCSKDSPACRSLFRVFLHPPSYQAYGTLHEPKRWAIPVRRTSYTPVAERS